MRLIKLFFIAAFLLTGIFSYVATVQTAPKTSEFSAAETEIQKSIKEVYAQNCARCHGADGRGQTTLGKTLDVPDIADAKWQSRHNDKKIAGKIAKGGGGMPAFAKKLSAGEITSLVAYVRSLKK
jgi:mono/diheme cytochrome c family protein